jgi:hypothetical protein
MVTPNTKPAAGLNWLMPWGQLQWLRQADERIARQFFDQPGSYVVGSTPFPSAGSPWACKVLPVFYSFETYAQAGAAMAGAKFPLVVADFENWPQTDVNVKKHPEASFWAFAQLAAARGQQMIAAPSRDIIYTPGCDKGWQWPETINDGYLRCQIPAVASAAAVAFVCQSQGAEKDLTAFSTLVAGAAKQVPNDVTLWAELTANLATADQMKAACDAALTCGAQPPVSGFWVVIADQTQAGTAAQFFHLVAGA